MAGKKSRMERRGRMKGEKRWEEGTEEKRERR